MRIEIDLDENLRHNIERRSLDAGLSVPEWLKRVAQEAVARQSPAEAGLRAFIGIGGAEASSDTSERVDEILYGT